jgi:hypothetical protein
MLEEYVVKNRRRILSLLGVQRISPAASAAVGGASAGQILHGSWHPLPKSDIKPGVADDKAKQQQQQERAALNAPKIYVVDECDANFASLCPKAPMGKRHSTGDASSVEGWGQHAILTQPSTVSLESDGNVRKTEVTDI